eukprot:CAMPEP_0201591014 /NCGR_PEP_ID=MMETSP0190_2-20130828/184433_1 /ASSEMBLY_ACC=CAM_ASM_000263 /TAXON_ID=37353 /ORGANISM="Rosalina sp." /LENGTH=340 /DNA_ID=CAMNT_0048048351 /DNA_START=138 /DNA_END=1160 /DNA_ORIENTATION=-
MSSAKQIVEAAIDSSDIEIEWINMPFGYGLYQNTGHAMNKDHLAAFEETRLILKGPITIPPGDTSFMIDNLDTGKSYTSPNQALRKIYQLYGHIRPAKSYKNSPFKNVDIVTIRENTEDLYTGEEHVKDNGDTVECIKRITKNASDRIANFALNYAKNNNRKLVTSVHKANVCKKSDGLFLNCHREIFKDSKEKYGIQYNENLADSILYKLMIAHSEFDVVSCPNLYGDLISDLLGGMIGSLGLMPAAQINQVEDYGLFEPTHGSAPDIAGQNIVNPISQWRSAVLMLQYLGYQEIGENIEEGIEYLLENDYVTHELGGKCTTTDMTNYLCKYLKGDKNF